MTNQSGKIAGRDGQYIMSIHILRGIAIFGVVATHSLNIFNWDEAPQTYQFLDGFLNQTSIWFAVVSGFLMQHINKDTEILEFYKIKLIKIVLPYIIVSIPAVIYYTSFSHTYRVAPEFYDRPTIERIALFFITGKQLAPFWYIPTVCIFFALQPLVRTIDRHPRLYLCLPFLLIISAILGRDGLLVYTGASYLFDSVSKAAYLFSVYILGMFCSRYYDTLTLYLERAIPYLLPLAFLTYFDLTVFQMEKTASIFIFKVSTCFVALYILTKINIDKSSIFSKISKYSFGIFFLHGYLIGLVDYLLNRKGVKICAGNIPLYATFSVSVFVTTYFMVLAAKKVLGSRSKYIIGT